MDRRELGRSGALALAGACAGCLGPTEQDATRSRSSPDTCEAVTADDLEALLPPPPSGRQRSVDTDASQAYLDEYEAVAAVSAEYRDADDAVLDDSTVRVFRFRDEAAPERLVVDQLNAVEFDSGRVGVGAVSGRLGFIAAAPSRDRARSLLAGSPALSRRCLDRRELLPVRTRTPASANGTPRRTETS